MGGTVARETRIRSVIETDSTRLLRTRYLPSETTADVALHIEPGAMGYRPSGQVARVIGDAGQWLAVINVAILIAAADLQTSLLSDRNPNESVDRHHVVGRLTQRTTGNTFITL